MDDGFVFRAVVTAVPASVAALKWVGVVLISKGIRDDSSRGVVRTSDFVVVMFLILVGLFFTMAAWAFATVESLYGP